MQTHKSGVEPPPSQGSNAITAARILTDRLRDLAIQPSGLPPHVLAHLRGLVDDEASRIQRELAAEVAALQQRAEGRLSKQAERLITLKSVGKAFVKPATARPGETPVSPHPNPAKSKGGAV